MRKIGPAVRRRRMSVCSWGTALLVALVACGVVRADSQAPITSHSLMADQLILLSRKCLAGPQQPSPQQLQCAYTLLSMAKPLIPDDPEFLRLWIELNQRMDHHTEVLTALARYCNLEPQDDAAQLQLILATVARAQTLDQRLAMVDRLLDSPAAAGLSAPLRSRLDSYAALALRELGRRVEVDRRVAQALQLDPTNIQAARLAYDAVLARQGSVRETGLAALGLIQANPVDSSFRRRLADVCFAGGDYSPAAQQYALAQSLATEQPDDGLYQSWVSCLLATNHLDEALAILNSLSQRGQPPAAPGAAPSAAPSTSGATPAAGGTLPSVGASTPPATPGAPAAGSGAVLPAGSLPLDLEVLRLAVFHLQGQDRSAQGSLNLITRELERRAKAGDSQAMADSLWLRCFLGPQLPTEAELAQLLKTHNPAEITIRHIRAWIALRDHSPQARQLLEGLGSKDPFSVYGLALLAPKGDSSLDQSFLKRTVLAGPMSLPGILAAQQLIASHVEPPTSVDAQAVAAAFKALPRSLRNPNLTPGNWVRLDVRPATDVCGYLQPVRLIATIRNAGEVPLGISSQGPISSRLFAYLEPSSMGRVIASLPPVVEDAQRRLVLGPHQAFKVTMRLDWAEAGWLLAGRPDARITLAGLAALGPEGSVAGHITVGPLGATDTIETIRIHGTALTPQNTDSQLAALSDPDTAVQMQAAAWLVQAAARLANATDPTTQQAARNIAQALTRKYESMDSLMQAWTVRFLTPDPAGKALLQTIHELAQRSDNPMVQVVYLASQVSDPASPLIDAAIRSRNATISDFGTAWRTVATQLKAAAKPATASPSH